MRRSDLIDHSHLGGVGIPYPRFVAAAMAGLMVLVALVAVAQRTIAQNDETGVHTTPFVGTPVASPARVVESTAVYDSASLISGTASVSAPEVFAAIHHVLPVEERKEVWNYLNTLSLLCDTLGLDFMVMTAQWDLETDTGRSSWWRVRKNPAGIGVTGDPAQNEASQTWPDGEAAAYGHVAHMVAYVWGAEWGTVWPGAWPAPLVADQRFNAPINAGYHAERLSDLNNTWAIDPQNNYHGKLADRANRIVERALANVKQPAAVP